jgi:hypothetical protein
MFVFKGVNFYVYRGEEGWEGSSIWAADAQSRFVANMRINHGSNALQKFQFPQVFPGLIEAATAQRRDKTAARFDPISGDFPIAPGE